MELRNCVLVWVFFLDFTQAVYNTKQQISNKIGSIHVTGIGDCYITNLISSMSRKDREKIDNHQKMHNFNINSIKLKYMAKCWNKLKDLVDKED
jgi:hypothetical protein